MTPTLPYDLSPIVHIAVLGVVLASGPLLWLWQRHRGATAAARLRALTVLALFFCFDLVLVGAYTRLSDSGLGCPDWPGCYGNASPLGARADIHAAQTAQPGGPVTLSKAWVEMLHRYLATGVGVLITALAIASWAVWLRQRRRGEPGGVGVPLWATATFVWVCLQGAFGAWTVTWKLYPAIVTAHLLGGMILLALLAAQARRWPRAPLALPRRLRRGVYAVCALVAVQLALGGWVSTNYAVLACSDFPTCQGAWWPAMDFAHGFTVLRELGAGKDGGWLPFAALTAIHVTHRAFAALVLAGMLLLAGRLRRESLHGDPAAGRFALGLAALALWQFASGLSNVVLGWPLPAALAHTGGAALLTVLLTLLVVRMRQGAPAAQRARRLPATAADATQLHHV
jgi:cytochrome c oxidase assembly protein subunit 15